MRATVRNQTIRSFKLFLAEQASVRTNPACTRRQLSFQNYALRSAIPPLRWYNSKRSFPDPSRTDVFYHYFSGPPAHLFSDLPVYALSFLPDFPPSVDSCTVIGWLPAVAEREGQDASLSDFKENGKFRALLHEAIRTGLRDDVDDIQINRAAQLQWGWMHIHDERNIPALGRIGDPDDILASVLVEDSKILPDTYQAMPSYRLCTADGLPQLTPGLAQKLRAMLEEGSKTASS